jgi:hypothetical protein
MATQFYYDLDVPVVDYNGVTPNEEGELGWNTTAKKMQVHDGTTVKPLAYEADVLPPLSAADQTLTAARTINLNSNTLAINGTSPDSDDGVILGLGTGGNHLRTRHADSARTLLNSGPPTNGTTVAWYVGQLLVNTNDNSIYRATAQSANPDAGGTGSVWAALPLAATPYVHTFVVGDWSAPASGFRSLSITQATHGKSATGPISVVTQQDDGTNWVEVDPHRVQINKSTGNITIQIADGSEFAGRAIVSSA